METVTMRVATWKVSDSFGLKRENPTLSFSVVKPIHRGRSKQNYDLHRGAFVNRHLKTETRDSRWDPSSKFASQSYRVKKNARMFDPSGMRSIWFGYVTSLTILDPENRRHNQIQTVSTACWVIERSQLHQRWKVGSDQILWAQSLLIPASAHL